MAVDLNSYFNEQFGIEQKDIRTYSPLTLAYIGDAVFDIIIRSILVNKGNTPVNKLHQRASQVVKAQTQAAMVLALMDQLTEAESDWYRRGRSLTQRQRMHPQWTTWRLQALKRCLDTFISQEIWTAYVSL